MEKWKGKVAVVTGASAGIGKAVCEKLVFAGVTVVGLARRQDILYEIAQSFRNHGVFYPINTDVSKEEEVLSAFKWIFKNLGPVHVLINCAGFNRNNNLVNGDTEKWREVFSTNVLGLCVVTREAVKNMRENNVHGHIIHINSIFGHSFQYFPSLNVYPASKFAVTALTETLRQELNFIASKIKISSISPGFVDSEFRQAADFCNNADQMKALSGTPELLPEDVANAVLYVLGTPPHVQVHDLIIKPIGEQA